MRRFSLCAIFLALAGSICVPIVVRSWAADPQPAVKASDDPFGDDAPAAAKRSAAKPAPAHQSEDSPPPGLRPYPAAPVAPPRAADQVAHGLVGTASALPPSIDRILTPEMAITPEPPVVDAVSGVARAAAAKINAALASTTAFDFNETPLADVVDQLKKRHKIEIQLDLAGLKDAGVDERTRITKHISGISLRSALRLILDELQLNYVIHNEVLLITSPQKAESDEFMLTRFYPVKDIVLVRNSSGEIQTDYQPLIDLIENTVAQKSWLDNGGTGTVTPFQFQDRCLLVVSQTQDVHEEIVDLLAKVRLLAGPAPKDIKDLRLPILPKVDVPSDVRSPGPQAPVTMPGTGIASTGMPALALSTSESSRPQASGTAPATRLVRILTPEMARTSEPPTISAALDSPAVAKIMAALDSPTEIDCDKTPLPDVVVRLCKRHKIEIQLDAAGLNDAGVDEDVPITKRLSGISLGAALRNVLDELQLKYVIHNEVLLITSPQRAESDEFMRTVIYPVKDLILVKNDKGEIETDFQPLIGTLQNNVCVKSWLDNGGTGTISAYQCRDRCLLVVSQTQEVQEQIADMLAALRKSGGAGADGSGGGKELLLPMRPKYIAPTYHLVPSAAMPRRGMGMGDMGGSIGGFWGSRPDFEHGGGVF